MHPAFPSIALACLVSTYPALAATPSTADLVTAMSDAHFHEAPARKAKHKIKDEPGDYEEEYEVEGVGFKKKVKEKEKPGEYEYEEETEYVDAHGEKRTVKFKRKCVKGVCEEEYED